MAEEIRKVITIDTNQAVNSLDKMKDSTDSAGQSFNSLKDYKQHIDHLTASLLDLDSTSDKYKETCDEIRSAQEKLNQAISDSKSQAAAAEGSYNALTKQMAELKKEWRATTDEVERTNLGEQINSINDQLKEMDASIGNYQRNVGNYEAAFSGAFKKMSENTDTFTKALKISNGGLGDMKDGFEALSKTPWLAILGMIVSLVLKLWDNIKGNTQAMEGLKKVSESLKPLMNFFNNIIGKIANLFSKLIGRVGDFIKESEGIKKVVGFVSGLGNAILQYMLTPIKTAIAAVKGLGKILGDVFKGNWKDIAKDAKEAGSAISEAFSSGFKFKSNFETGKAIGQSLTAAAGSKEVKDAAEAAGSSVGSAVAQATADSLKKADKEIADSLKIFIDNIDKQLAEIDKINQESLYILNGDAGQRQKEIDALTETYETKKKLFEEYNEDTTFLTEAYNKQLEEINKKYADKAIKDAEDAKKKREEVLNSKISGVDSGLSNAIFLAQSEVKAEYDKNNKIFELREAALQKKLELYQAEEDGANKYKDEIALITAELNGLAAERSNNEKMHIQEQIDAWSNLSNSVGSLFGTVSEMYMDNIKKRFEAGKLNEQQAKKEFELAKKGQLAQAWISTLSGVAGAIASPFTNVADGVKPTSWKIALAATTGAAQLASGLAQINKIKSTQFEGGSISGGVSGAVASVAPEVTNYNPNYVTSATGSSDTAMINESINGLKDSMSDQRVYVVESDIRETGKKVDVRNQEINF